MNSSWFEIEQVARYRQDDLLKVAADIRQAEQVRRALAATARRSAATTRPMTPMVQRRPRVTLAARLGRTLVVVGKRLQGTSA